MKWVLPCFLLLAVLGLAVPAQSAELPVFPGASGFGSKTVAGSGRHLNPPATRIYQVSSRANSGKGTLRECVEATVPRVCVFTTSGRIQLSKELVISSPYITIAGQTAPAPGVLITGAGLRISTHNVLVQHLQIRVGDDPVGPPPETRDGLVFSGSSSKPVYNVVVDHVSVSWGIDENVSMYYQTTRDITLSNSIVSESLYRSTHPKGAHGMGVLLGDNTKRITLHHNLLAHNHDRNPRMKHGATVEFINNVVYNWGGSSGWNQANLSDTDKTGIPVLLNFVGNVYIPGPNSPSGPTLYGSPVASNTRAYVSGNIGPTRLQESMDDWLISSLPAKHRSSIPVIDWSGVDDQPPFDALERVLTRSGARPRERNNIDTRVVSEVRNRNGSHKDCVTGCARSAGPYPTVAVSSRKLPIPPNPNSDADGDGYTNLEEWLHTEALLVE